MNTYLMIYSNTMCEREEMKNIIDSIPEISNWRYDIPNSFYIQSTYSADKLVEILEKKFENKDKRFLIVQITENSQGFLTKETWDFINIKDD